MLGGLPGGLSCGAPHVGGERSAAVGLAASFGVTVGHPRCRSVLHVWWFSDVQWLTCGGSLMFGVLRVVCWGVSFPKSLCFTWYAGGSFPKSHVACGLLGYFFKWYAGVSLQPVPTFDDARVPLP